MDKARAEQQLCLKNKDITAQLQKPHPRLAYAASYRYAGRVPPRRETHRQGPQMPGLGLFSWHRQEKDTFPSGVGLRRGRDPSEANSYANRVKG
ncbi:hypothetical protein llap_16028 [Limosa lapponica baueri]|uniref:Uncharacterized protein n=1 Tax=Limosa lapponica baueri TaxID=1758121 RepID=A0A2I0TIN1_LIMLA|nr:hypothetical protein llap_16028 [Limosa lapponica baueri]